MNKPLKFFRGLKEKYNLKEHGDGIYFTTDSCEIIHNNKSYLGTADINYKIVNHGKSDTTFILTPNTFHIWDSVQVLNLTLGEEIPNVVNEYLFQFTSDSTMLILPNNIKWNNPIKIQNDKIYQISILNNLATYLEFSNS